MSKLRSINTCFWSDPLIEQLNPEAKLLFIYLITNEKTNMLGIYESSVKKMAFETGISQDNIKAYLKDFEEFGKVKYINNYVVLVNYMKHQNYNTNMKKSAIDVYNNLPKELKDKSLVVDKNNPLKGFESLLNHYGMVRKVEVEYEYEEEKEVEVEDKPKKDVFYTIDKLQEFYLNDEKVINAVISNTKNRMLNTVHLKERLDEFSISLIQNGEQSKTFSDFCKHFRLWHLKTIDIKDTTVKKEILPPTHRSNFVL